MRTLMLAAFSIAAFSTCGAAFAQLTNIRFSRQPTTPELPGHVATDVAIDFLGELSGSQMIVNIHQGSIFQDAFGGDTPPNGVLVTLPGFETLKWDTFIANGSLVNSSPLDAPSALGGAINLGGDVMPEFSDTTINQAWSPPAGAAFADQQNFLVARLTLSNDATGTPEYLGAAGGELSQPAVFNIINGFVGALISPSPGDFNFSFQVEQGDLDLVLLHWGASAQPPPDGWFHDFPEGIVDQEELDRVLLNWGRTGSAVAVPEPRALLLAVAIAILALSSAARSRLAATFTSVLLAGTTMAGEVSVTTEFTPSAVPPFVVQDFLIDWTGEYAGSELYVGLSSGQIYQDPLGGNTSPSAALVDDFPDLQWDTYVTQGSEFSDTSGPIVLGGGAVNLGGEPALEFSTAVINQAWGPGEGVAVESGSNFLTARLTLSPDANGFLRYLAYLESGEFAHINVDIANGVFSLQLSPSEGDYDASRLVEQADLDLVLANWGNPSFPIPHGWFYDLPTAPLVDQEELDKVLLNWGRGVRFLQSVPEPGTAVLSAIMIVAVFAWQWQRGW